MRLPALPHIEPSSGRSGGLWAGSIFAKYLANIPLLVCGCVSDCSRKEGREGKKEGDFSFSPPSVPARLAASRHRPLAPSAPPCLTVACSSEPGARLFLLSSFSFFFFLFPPSFSAGGQASAEGFSWAVTILAQPASGVAFLS